MEILTGELLVGMMVWGMWEGGRKRGNRTEARFKVSGELAEVSHSFHVESDWYTDRYSTRSVAILTFTLLKPSSSKSVRIASQHWMRVGINAIFY